MEVKLKLNAKKILEKKFTPNVAGYDPKEVDKYLDQIIKDYKTLEEILPQLIKSYERAIKSLEDEIKRLGEVDAKNKLIEDKLKVLNKNKYIALERVDLLVRIDKLERALYKEVVNPNKIV